MSHVSRCGGIRQITVRSSCRPRGLPGWPGTPCSLRQHGVTDWLMCRRCVRIADMEAGSGLTSLRRSWLERVLDVVRVLGASDDLNQILDRVVEAVVEVLEFGAAAINVTTPDGAA